MPYLLIRSPQQDVTCMHWNYITQNLIYILPNKKCNQNLLSHFQLTTIIQQLEPIRFIMLNIHKFNLLTRVVLAILEQLSLFIIKLHTFFCTWQRIWKMFSFCWSISSSLTWTWSVRLITMALLLTFFRYSRHAFGSFFPWKLGILILIDLDSPHKSLWSPRSHEFSLLLNALPWLKLILFWL